MGKKVINFFNMIATCTQRIENLRNNPWIYHSVKCPDTEFVLVRIFSHSNWIRRDTPYLSIFSPNAGKEGPEKTLYLEQTVIYMSKANNINTRNKYEICSKLTVKTRERCPWCSSGVFIVNVEHISCLFLVSQIFEFEHCLLKLMQNVDL